MIQLGFKTFGSILRRVIPGLTTLLLVFLTHLHLPLPFYADVAPALPLIGIYYWVVFRPDLMPRILVFVIGLFQDALIGAPFGLSAIVYLLAHEFVFSQRRFLLGKPFWIFWSGFGIVAPAATALTWLIVSALRGAVLPSGVMLTSIGLTVLIFPAIVWFLLHSQRWLVGAADPA